MHISKGKMALGKYFWGVNQLVWILGLFKGFNGLYDLLLSLTDCSI